MGNYLCSWCGKEFERKGGEHYCSDACRRESELSRKREASRSWYWKDKNRGYRDGLYECSCIHCGKTFWAEDYRTRICSDECRSERKQMVDARRHGRTTAALKKPPSLTERAVEARKLGISYGQLMARKEAGR